MQFTLMSANHITPNQLDLGCEHLWRIPLTEAIVVAQTRPAVIPILQQKLIAERGDSLTASGTRVPVKVFQALVSGITTPFLLGDPLGDSEVRRHEKAGFLPTSDGKGLDVCHSEVKILLEDDLLLPEGEGVVEVPVRGLPSLPHWLMLMLSTRSSLARRGIGLTRPGCGPSALGSRDILVSTRQIIPGGAKAPRSLYVHYKNDTGNPFSLRRDCSIAGASAFYSFPTQRVSACPDFVADRLYSTEQTIALDSVFRLVGLLRKRELTQLRLLNAPSTTELEEACFDPLPDQWPAPTAKLHVNRDGEGSFGGLRLWGTVSTHKIPNFLKGVIANDLANQDEGIDMLSFGSFVDLPGSQNRLTVEASYFRSPQPRPESSGGIVYYTMKVAGNSDPYRGQFCSSSMTAKLGHPLATNPTKPSAQIPPRHV